MRMNANDEVRWIYYPVEGVPQLGEVTETGGKYIVSFLDGREFVWETLARRARFVTEQSPEYRALRDPEGTKRSFANTPVELIVEALADRGQPMQSDEVQRVFVELQLLEETAAKDWWKRLQVSLKRHPHVDSSDSRPVKYSYRKEPRVAIATRSAGDILEELSKPKIANTRRKQLLGELRPLTE